MGLPEDGWVFWMWTLMDHIKFWVLSALLSLFGYATYAQKLWGGWMVRLCARSTAMHAFAVQRSLRASSRAAPRHTASCPVLRQGRRGARACRDPAALHACCL